LIGIINSLNKKENDRSDREIALLVQEGRKDLFGVLVERYQKKLERYGQRFFNSPQDIEDIIQQVFIKAYKNIQSFNTDKKFSPWLYRIAHNEFVNKLDKKSRSPLCFFDPDTIFPHLLKEEEQAEEKGIVEKTIRLIR